MQQNIPVQRMKFSKSYDNLNDLIPVGTETQYNEFGEPIGLKKDFNVQCDPATIAYDIEESLKADSPGIS